MRITRSARALVTVGATALVLSACGTSADEASAPTGDSSPVSGAGEGEITVWTWEGAPGAEAMERLATAFEEKTGVTVNSEIKERLDYTPQVQLALNSGEAIDVLGVQPSQFATQVQHQLRPVSEWEDSLAEGLDGYSPATMDQIQRLYGGEEIYSVPLASAGSAMCLYNADILEEVGVEPPETWDDVKALSEALAAQRPDVLTLVKPSGADAWFEDEFALTMVGQYDPEFYNQVRYEDGAWNTEAYVEGLSRYGELYEDGTLPRAGLDLGYGDAMNAFNTGKAAIACNGTWEAGLLKESFRQENGIAASAIGAIPVPADDPADRCLRSFLDITWGIPTTAQNPAAAAAFISFASQEEGVDLWAEGLGFVPAAEGWELDPAVLGDDELAAEGYSLIQELIADPCSDRNNLSQFSAQVGTYVLEVAQGRMSAQEAADKGQADLESGLYE